jgi:phosphoribosylaminoimidazolecarboxamide formyltransferase/IMP cyclohydrolase
LKRALLSVYDKTGITELARVLVDLGWELISTGGTLAALNEAGIPVQSVSDVTGFPEILNGRVKTLHPRIHGGLLARMDIPDHVTSLAEHDIQPIELVVCNLYPFEATVSKPGVDLVEAVEQIDIGGPAMIRAAAKNFHHVTVLVSPQDYDYFLERLRSDGVGMEQRRAYAARAFAHVSAYDAVVAEFLRGPDASFPTELTFAGRKQMDLRYGENPGQRAAAYFRIVAGHSSNGILTARQLHGKELSYNNVLDADAAWSALRRFERPGVAIVKHTIPCGLALHDQLNIAFERAFAGDPVSAFGGIVALNRPVDVTTAQKIDAIFFEVVVAPGFEPDALALLQRKRQLRLLEMGSSHRERSDLTIRDIDGGFLVQEPDNQRDDPANWLSVADREPTSEELRNLEFAWEACRHVKSNAIVLAANESMTGVGSGQPNRVESVRIAVAKAGPRTYGSVLASDAFFPFADGVEAAIAGGVTAIVQPGGSVRDEEVIAAANKGGVAMLFTGNRHFLH